LEYTKQSESITREIVETQSVTRQKSLELQQQEIEKQLAVSMANLESTLKMKEKELKAQLEQRTTIENISASELKIQQEQNNMDLMIKQKEVELYIQELEAQVKAVVEKANAISPDLVAALQSFSDKALAEKMAESMAPLAILGGKSVAEILSNLLKGTIVERVLNNLPEKLGE
jgi:major vault protein